MSQNESVDISNVVGSSTKTFPEFAKSILDIVASSKIKTLVGRELVELLTKLTDFRLAVDNQLWYESKAKSEYLISVWQLFTFASEYIYIHLFAYRYKKLSISQSSNLSSILSCCFSSSIPFSAS